MKLDEVSCYNLRLIGEHVQIISTDDTLELYWPRRLSIPLAGNEHVIWIEEDRIYCGAWVEEGLDGERITDRYRYYENLIVKDLKGNVLEQKPGCLSRQPDGTWRIS